MAHISRLKKTEIAAGKPCSAGDVDVELDQLVTTYNLHDDRIAQNETDIATNAAGIAVLDGQNLDTRLTAAESDIDDLELVSLSGYSRYGSSWTPHVLANTDPSIMVYDDAVSAGVLTLPDPNGAGFDSGSRYLVATIQKPLVIQAAVTDAVAEMAGTSNTYDTILYKGDSAHIMMSDAFTTAQQWIVSVVRVKREDDYTIVNGDSGGTITIDAEMSPNMIYADLAVLTTTQDVDVDLPAITDGMRGQKMRILRFDDDTDSDLTVNPSAGDSILGAAGSVIVDPRIAGRSSNVATIECIDDSASGIWLLTQH